MNPRAERTPAHAAFAGGHVPQLNDGQADHAVRPAEAVVLHGQLQLVAVGGLLSQDAVGDTDGQPRPDTPAQHAGPNSQLEGLVELGRPAVVLRLGGEAALLVGEEGTDHGELHEGPEHPGRLPLHVVHRHDWGGDRALKTAEKTGKANVSKHRNNYQSKKRKSSLKTLPGKSETGS